MDMNREVPSADRVTAFGIPQGLGTRSINEISAFRNQLVEAFPPPDDFGELYPAMESHADRVAAFAIPQAFPREENRMESSTDRVAVSATPQPVPAEVCAVESRADRVAALTTLLQERNTSTASFAAPRSNNLTLYQRIRRIFCFSS